MDRRKGSGGLAEATASRLRFEDSDEVAEEVGESAAAEGEAAAAEVISSEKTSADYNFDSYSHFGTHASSLHFVLLRFHARKGIAETGPEREKMILAVLFANSDGNILIERFHGAPAEERLHWRSFEARVREPQGGQERGAPRCLTQEVEGGTSTSRNGIHFMITCGAAETLMDKLLDNAVDINLVKAGSIYPL